MTLTRRGLLSGCAAPFVRAASAQPPNIVFILADDLGWGDLGCYGHRQIRTPNLDRLASQGSLFTQFYVANPVCSPSRTAFMSGRFPARYRVHGHFAQPEMNQRRGMPNFLDAAAPMLPRQLKEVGYVTGHFGKWHLGSGPGAPPPGAYGVDEHRTYGSNGPGFPQEPAYWSNLAARITDEGLRFMERHKGRPFYLNLWSNLTHAPLDPTEEQMEPYAKLRPGTSKFGDTMKRFAGTMQVYYSSVSELDRQVGRVLARLDELGIAENTIVVFSSDNGPEDIHLVETAHSGIGSAGPFRGRKRSLYEGGVRVPFLVRWPGRVPAKRVDRESVIGAVDLLPTMASIAGASVPATAGIDGENVRDIVLDGRSRPRSRPLLWEWRFQIIGDHMHRSPILSIRDGEYKLLFNPDGSRTELYDIPRDPYESENLALQRPEVVRKLRETALAWQKTLPPGPMDPGAGQREYPWPR